MKISITSAQWEFFCEEGHLELEGVFSPEEIEALESAREKGQNFWRQSSAIEKIVYSRRMAQIAAQLFEQSALRLGYDLNLPGETYSIKEKCSIQGVIGGCLVHVSGNVTFIKPDYEFLFENSLLIVYVRPNAVYIRNPADPMAHYLKGLGYSYGDRLRDDLNPIIYK